MRVDVVRDEQGLAALQPEWDALLAASRQNGPFLRHFWLKAWWEAFGEGKLNVVTARAIGSGGLLGVLPLFATRMGRLTPVRAARFLGDSEVGSTGLTAFAHHSAERDVFSRFAAYIRYGDHGWDVVDLRFMDPENAFFDVIRHAGASHAESDCGACPRIVLPADWEGYLMSLPGKKRNDLLRTQRRAAERGFGLESIGDAALLEEAVDDLLRLQELNLRRKLGAKYSVSPEFRTFTQETSRRLFAEDRLRLLFFTFEGRRVAAAYQFRDGDTMYGEQCGFDAGQGLPNLVRPLIGYAIKQAIEEGCSTFDTLLGDQAYKRDLGVTEVRHFVRVQVYAGSLAGTLRRTRDALVERPRGPAEPRAEDGGRAESRPRSDAGAEPDLDLRWRQG